MKRMISNLINFSKLAFSSKNSDFGDDVLHGDSSRVSIADSMLIQGSVIGAKGRSVGSRELRMMMARVDENDMRA